MDDAKKLAEVSAQLADPVRAAMILNLMDGSSRPAGELRLAANISPSSASTHLSKLVNARILTVAKQGRAKYYRITTAAVAHAVEALQIIASPIVSTPVATLRAAARSPLNPFSFARTCYDHLAGKLGVEVTAALQKQNIIRASGKTYEVTDSGAVWLRELGIDATTLKAERRMFATQCLDFTERRHHLAGALGAALLARMIELDWIHQSHMPRSVRLTTKGRTELGKRLRLEFTEGQNVRYKPD
jgi:DNA-binding transcriptional ArsR family regulator